MNKFLKVMLIFLTIFIGVLIVQFTMDFTNSKETNKIEDANTQISPEELQTQTTIAITDIVLNQLLENIILNIEFKQHENQQDVTLYLQGNEFVSEDTLFKDSYNILKEISKNETIRDFTFKWYMLVKNNNTEVLTLSFSQDTISKVESLSYQQLKQLATHYEKHAALK
ncbi:hypothetical protein CSE16_03390 [Solibacillus sp. R5-41]|uniref:hypothetical protein n=1 Tax=Solibacillus sp. R5-41 TaxID=2048654 RepID=UPI000C126888|nr:hypothetical protein [Solibacillus sp. R5-41]ATP39148.1 hypothetical protein CSE16_03390 [Solibacillus sp. R5-41]